MLPVAVGEGGAGAEREGDACWGGGCGLRRVADRRRCAWRACPGRHRCKMAPRPCKGGTRACPKRSLAETKPVRLLVSVSSHCPPRAARKSSRGPCRAAPSPARGPASGPLPPPSGPCPRAARHPPLVLAAPARPATNRCGRAPRPALGGGCIRGPTKAEAGPGYRHRAERRGMRRGTCRASGPTITSARTARRCDSRPATGLRPEGPVQAAEAAPGACGAVYRGAASESRRASVSQ